MEIIRRLGDLRPMTGQREAAGGRREQLLLPAEFFKFQAYWRISCPVRALFGDMRNIREKFLPTYSW